MAQPLVCEQCGKPDDPELGTVALLSDPDDGAERPFHASCYEEFLEQREGEFFDDVLS